MGIIKAIRYYLIRDLTLTAAHPEGVVWSATVSSVDGLLQGFPSGHRE